MIIKGAYMNIREFLHTNEEVSINYNGREYWTFEANREIIIPDYQREYRWGEKQLYELLEDIDSGTCYIGQIALTHENNKPKIYNIVDGQQRITSLIILLTILCRYFYIYNDSSSADEYNLHSDTNRILNFSSNCFSGFQEFISQIYDFKELSKEYFEKPETDCYNQFDSYINACILFDDKISSKISYISEEAYKLKEIQNIINKIYDAKISVVVFEDNKSYNGEAIFLDINEKGLKLDDEDILKAHYFNNSASNKQEDTLNTWKSLKTNYFKILDCVNVKKIKIESFVNYFLRIIISTNKDDYNFNDFDDKLRCNTKSKKHICTLFNKTELQENIKIVSEFLKEITELTNNDSNSKFYKEYFDKKVDSYTKKIFKTLFMSIVKSDMKIVWIALIKIWLLRHKNSEHLLYNDIIQLFSFYVLSAISGKRKETTFFSNEFTSAKTIDDMYNELFRIEENILEEKYRKSNVLKNDQSGAEYLSLNLQIFYNDFEFNYDKKLWDLNIKKDKFLEKYSSYKNNYCKDHFIVQRAKTIILNNGTEYIVPNSLNKFKNRAYNFLYHKDIFENKDFVSRLIELHNSDKENYGEYEKNYLLFLENELANFYKKRGNDEITFEKAIELYDSNAQQDYESLVRDILEDGILIWHSSICEYLSKKFIKSN